MYYATVFKDEETIVSRKPFHDFSEALKYFGAYYQPRSGRGTLSFTKEVKEGEFVRSYTELVDPATLDNHVDNNYNSRYLRAVKMSNAFIYNGSYFFLVESELGIQEVQKELEEDE